MTTVTLLGTGTMGVGMAHALLREGLAVRAWNRTPDKARPLADDGATVATSVAEAVRGADVVLTMLFDADSVLEVVGEAAGEMGDALWLQCSTVGVDGAQRCADLAREHGLALLDTPVLGTKDPAEKGALVVLAAGDPALRERARPVLDAIGSRTVWAGDEVGRASALKLACNAWVAAITAATAQSVALAGGLGLDPNLFLDALDGGASDSPYAHVKGKAMIAGEYPVAFALDGVRKDLGLITEAVGTAGVSPVLVDALRAAFDAASEQGHGGEDIAAVHAAFAPRE